MAKRRLANLGRERSRRRAAVHVHVQALIKPVPREFLALAELHVHPVTHRVARLPVVVDPAELQRRVAPGELGAGQPARIVVIGIAQKDLRAGLPAGLRHVGVTVLLVDRGVVRVLGLPLRHRVDNLLDRGDRAVGLGEVFDQVGIEHVPGVVVVNLGHHVGIDRVAAGRQTDVAGQAHHIRRAHRTERVAVDVEQLDGIQDGVFPLKVLGGRRIGLLESDFRVEDRQGLVLVAHPVLDERFLPGLKAGDVGDLVREHFDVAHHAHRPSGAWGCLPGARRGCDHGEYCDGGAQPFAIRNFHSTTSFLD